MRRGGGQHVAKRVVRRRSVEVGKAGADGGKRGVDVGGGAGEVGEERGRERDAGREKRGRTALSEGHGSGLQGGTGGVATGGSDRTVYMEVDEAGCQPEAVRVDRAVGGDGGDR